MEKNLAELKYYIGAQNRLIEEATRSRAVARKITLKILELEGAIIQERRWIAGILKLCRTGK